MIFTFVIFLLSATHITDSLLTGIPTIGINPGTGIVISEAGDNPTFGDERCKSCTNRVIAGFDSIKPLILKYNNQTISGMGVCSYCVVSGINTIHPYGDSCVSYVPNNRNKTTTRVFLKIDNYTTVCNCTFSNSLPEFQKNLDSFLVSSNSCGPDVDSVTGIVDGTGQGATALNSIINPSTLASCQQLNSSGSTETIVTVIRYNLTFYIDVVEDKTIKGPKSTSVAKVKVINRDFKNIDVSCNSTLSTPVCECILDTQVFKVAVDDLETFVLNCALKNETNTQVKGAFNSYVSCADYF